MIRMSSIAAMALAVSCGPASAQSAAEVNASMDALFGASQPFEQAFQSIREAVADHDAVALSPWIAYPFRVSYDDEELVVENPAEFIDNYDDIVTDDIAEAVAAQDYGTLFVNSDGVMFGNGEMWMTMVCEDEACAKTAVKVITIQSTR